MDVIVSQQALSRAFHLVAPLADGGQPIAKYLRMVASGSELCLEACNEEVSMQYRVPATVQHTGSALLPPKLLAELVSGLPAETLKLVAPFPNQSGKALLQCQQTRALLTLPAPQIDEFPHIPLLSDASMGELLLMDGELHKAVPKGIRKQAHLGVCEKPLDRRPLPPLRNEGTASPLDERGTPRIRCGGVSVKEIIGQVVFAASSDHNRPALGGVRIVIGQGKATFAAADAFRAVTRSIAIPLHESRTLLIPASTLNILARLLPETGAVQIALAGKQQIVFHTQQMDLSAPQDGGGTA